MQDCGSVQDYGGTATRGEAVSDDEVRTLRAA